MEIQSDPIAYLPTLFNEAENSHTTTSTNLIGIDNQKRSVQDLTNTNEHFSMLGDVFKKLIIERHLPYHKDRLGLLKSCKLFRHWAIDTPVSLSLKKAEFQSLESLKSSLLLLKPKSINDFHTVKIQENTSLKNKDTKPTYRPITTSEIKDIYAAFAQKNAPLRCVQFSASINNQLDGAFNTFDDVKNYFVQFKHLASLPIIESIHIAQQQENHPIRPLTAKENAELHLYLHENNIKLRQIDLFNTYFPSFEVLKTYIASLSYCTQLNFGLQTFISNATNTVNHISLDQLKEALIGLSSNKSQLKRLPDSCLKFESKEALIDFLSRFKELTHYNNYYFYINREVLKGFDATAVLEALAKSNKKISNLTFSPQAFKNMNEVINILTSFKNLENISHLQLIKINDQSLTVDDAREIYNELAKNKIKLTSICIPRINYSSPDELISLITISKNTARTVFHLQNSTINNTPISDKQALYIKDEVKKTGMHCDFYG